MITTPDLLGYDEGGPGLDVERGMYIRILQLGPTNIIIHVMKC
jgi:hypothetical protein